MSGLLRPTAIGEVPGDGVRRPVSSDVAPPAEGTVQPTENTRTGADAEAPPVEETRPAVPEFSEPSAGPDAGSGTAEETTRPRPAAPAPQGSGLSAPSEGSGAGSSTDPEVTQPLSPAEEPSGGFGLASAPTGRRVRARLARFNAPWQSTQVSEVLEPL